MQPFRIFLFSFLFNAGRPPPSCFFWQLDLISSVFYCCVQEEYGLPSFFFSCFLSMGHQCEANASQIITMRSLYRQTWRLFLTLLALPSFPMHQVSKIPHSGLKFYGTRSSLGCWKIKAGQPRVVVGAAYRATSAIDETCTSAFPYEVFIVRRSLILKEKKIP